MAYKDDINRKSSSSSYYSWIILIGMFALLFIAPFHKALFNGEISEFEGAIYYTFLFSAILLILVSFTFLKGKFKTHTELLMLLVWLIPLSYVLSLIKNVSHHFAMNGIQIHIMYAAFFVLGAYIARKHKAIVIGGMLLSCYVLTIYGFLNFFGFAHYQDAMLWDVRLSNVFQYPNTYAAYLIGFLLVNLLLSVSLKNKYLLAPIYAMVSPILISIFLTLSRGGLVILLIVSLIVIAFLPIRKQFQAIVNFIITLLISFIFLNKITSYKLSSNFTGFLVLILACAITSALLFGSSVLFEKWHKKAGDRPNSRFSHLYLPVGSVLVSLAILSILIMSPSLSSKILPHSLNETLQSINLKDKNLISRSNFYIDSTKIFKQSPIIGTGGDSWAVLYDKFKSYPYVSKQAHNFIIQYVLEVGIVGLIFFLLLIGYVLYVFIRSRRENGVENNIAQLCFFILACSIFLHSLIDFDMSFVYIGILLFFSLGCMAVTEKEFKIRLVQESRAKLVYFGFLFIVGVVSFFWATQYVSANSKYQAAVKQMSTNNFNYNEVTAKLDTILKYNHPEYLTAKINLLAGGYQQTKNEMFYQEALRYLDQFRKNDPYNRQLVSIEYSLYLNKGDFVKANDIILKALNNFPWEISLYNSAIQVNAKLAEDAGNEIDKKKYQEQEIALHKEYKDRLDYINTLSEDKKAESSGFRLDAISAVQIGKLYFERQNYQAVVDELQRFSNVKINKPELGEAGRYYIAATIKLGKADTNFQNAFIRDFPGEQDSIKKLTN